MFHFHPSGSVLAFFVSYLHINIDQCILFYLPPLTSFLFKMVLLNCNPFCLRGYNGLELVYGLPRP